MNRKRAFLTGLLCGTCVTAAVALLARRVEPPVTPPVAATSGVPTMPLMDYAYHVGYRTPNAAAQPVPEPKGRTFNGQPLYFIPLKAVAAR